MLPLVLFLLLWEVSFGGQLERLVDLAMQNSPRLKAYQGQIRAVEHMSEYAKSLPNPNLLFGLNNLPTNRPYPNSDEPMSGFSVGFSQMLVLPIKREKESQIYIKEKEMLQVRQELTRRELIAELKEAYYSYQQTFKKEDVYRGILKDLDLLERLAEENYKLARANLSDIIGIKVKKREVHRSVIELLRERDALLERIRYLVGVPVDVQREEVRAEEVDFPQDVQESPMLKEVFAQVELVKAQMERARVEHLPDVELMAEYMVRPSIPDMINLRLSLSIPIYKSKREDLSVFEKMERLNSLRQTLEDTRLRLMRELSSIRIEYLRTKDELEVIRELEREKLGEIQALELSYKYAKVDFRDLLGAYRELWDIRLMAVDKERELLSSLSRLEVFR